MDIMLPQLRADIVAFEDFYGTKTYDLSKIEPFNLLGDFLKKVPTIYVESLKGFTKDADIIMHIKMINAAHKIILSIKPNYYIDCSCKLCKAERESYMDGLEMCRCYTCPDILNYIIELLIKDVGGKAKKRGFFAKIFHKG